ncbi:methylaspartate mutase subunit E, partial [Clostridium sp. P21]|nr:methylaspartate mutase subunit E [Clostridium muellerianum]
FELGNGDLAVGTVKGFDAGIVDIPFAPSKFNAGKMMPARDNNGAVRYLNFGNLPLTEELKAFNTRKLEERGKFEGREVTFQMTIDDIFAVGKGVLIGRPE